MHVTLEILPIMPALCSMLFDARYAINYASIIGSSLLLGWCPILAPLIHTCVYVQGRIQGVKRPLLPELYWESLKSGVVAIKCIVFLILVSFQYFMRYNLLYLIWGCTPTSIYTIQV